MFKSIRRKIRQSVWEYVRNRYLFKPVMRESLCIQGFFYSAFRALKFNRIEGDYAEFGCYRGWTFALAYRESRRPTKLWAFDSFQGLPEPTGPKDNHPVWKKGAMTMTLDEFHEACAKNGIPADSYEAVPGFYDETLAKASPTDPPTDIALAYIDCDMYSSAKAVLDYLKTRLKHGMIIAFDDYFCFSADQVSGERKAILEAFPDDGRWNLLPYIQYNWAGQSFVVEDKKIINA